MRRSEHESEGSAVHHRDGVHLHNDWTGRASWVPVAGMIVVICGLAAAGYVYYSRERAAAWTANQAELKAIAIMKADSVTAWRNERLQDARLGASGLVAVLAVSLAEGVEDRGQRADLLDYLKLIGKYEGYQNVILARPDGSHLLSSEPCVPDLDGQEERLIGQAIAAGDAVFGELYRCHGCDRVHVDVAAPIPDGQGRPAAVLILRTDPDVGLFPLVQLWPTPSPSAETLLVTKDGDEVLLLNVLRHKTGPALSVRFSLSRTDVPAVQAALGRTGEFEGRDYGGVEVLSEILPVAGSPWVIVSKIDTDEVLAGFHAQRWLLLVCFVLAVLLAASLGHMAQRTGRQRAARAMEASEKRYRRLFEAARDGILILDATTGKIVDVNPFLMELTGYSHEEFLGRHLWEIGTFKDIASSAEAFAELQAKEYIRYDDLPLRTHDGRQVAVEFVSNVYLVDGHKVIQCNIRDISARKQAESELRQSEERFRVLFEHAADCILVLEPTLGGPPVIRDANEATLSVLGYRRDEVIGQPITLLDGASEAVIVERLREVGTSTGAVFDVTHRCKDGTNKYFECSGKQTTIGGKNFIISVERDVTERRRLEAERAAREAGLMVSQKLESIGTLASGVAHEINNPLNVILNYGQLILDEPSVSARVKDFAGNIVKESDRVAGIVRTLLDFARQERETYSPSGMVEIVERTLSLTRAVLRKDQITVQYEVPAELPVVECRSQQIQQVLMNLLTNARDATNERHAGTSAEKTITISTSTFENEGTGWVRLTVEDHGAGIPADVADRIFDPFFTTKGRDKGTGLGLSISYSIVKEHRGMISFESTPGTGTRFHVDLPVDHEQTKPGRLAS